MQTKLSGVGACDKRRGLRRLGIGIFGKDVHRKNRQRRLYTTTTTTTTAMTTKVNIGMIILFTASGCRRLCWDVKGEQQQQQQAQQQQQ